MKLRIIKATISTVLILTTIITTLFVSTVSVSAKGVYNGLFRVGSAEEYTGKKICTQFYKGYAKLKGLKKGKDYKVTYKNNVKIGQNTAQEIVTFIGKYKNRKQIVKKFSIAPPAPKITNVYYNDKTRTLTIRFQHNKNAKYVFAAIVSNEFDILGTKYIKNKSGTKQDSVSIKLWDKNRDYKIGLQSRMSKKEKEDVASEAHFYYSFSSNVNVA